MKQTWLWAVALTCIAGTASAGETMERVPYRWTNVPIGGGGAIPSIQLHPKVQGLAYITTDVGGSYRWEEEVGRWTPLLDWLPYKDRELYGVESLAFDPSDATGNKLYIVAGANIAGPKGEIFKSGDRGRTWKRTGHRVWAGSNFTQMNAFRLAVDPHNGDVLYHASREGLFRSTDAAESWSLVTSAPTGNIAPNSKGISGIGLIVFDRSMGTVEISAGDKTMTVTRSMYISADANPSWFHSADGGQTWRTLEGGPPPGRQGYVTSKGWLYVTSDHGLSKFDGNTWSTLWPKAGDARDNRTAVALAIDPSNEQRIILSNFRYGFGNPVLVSTDSGANWRPIEDKHIWDAAWYNEEQTRASVFSIGIDPFQSNRVWYTDWYQPWRSEDFWNDKVQWHSKVRGIEEVVSTGILVSPPTGDAFVFSGFADNDGFRHTSFSDYPKTKIPLHLTITGIDFQESNPQFMVFTGTSGWNGFGSGAYSSDGGKTLQRFESLPFKELRGGRVAVSANSERIVWATGTGGLFWSADRGKSWSAARGAAAKSGMHAIIFDSNQPLASDRINGQKFYHYSDGSLFRSTNGGEDWERTAAELPRDWEYKLVTSPAKEGEMLLAISGQWFKGLFLSTDSGSSFTRLPEVQNAWNISYGKGKSPGTAAMYLFGKVHDREGIFRSDNCGAGWVQINVDEPYPSRTAAAMVGDRQVYGRVYIATAGRGLYVGEPRLEH